MKTLLSRFTIAATMTSLSLISFASADDKVKTREVKFDDITLSVPSTWKQGTPTSRLRLGQFAVPAVKGDKEETELAIFFFGANSGGVQANIDRWVGQFSAEGRKTKILEGASKQGKYYVVDISGTYNKSSGGPFSGKKTPKPGSRMLAIILKVEKKGNYFLKLTGPNKTVTAAAKAFRDSFGGDAKSEKEVGE